MSLRSESIRAYRQLYRAAHVAGAECPLHNPTGFVDYVSRRFQQVSDVQRRKLSLSMSELDRRAKEATAANSSTHSGRQTSAAVRQQQKQQLAKIARRRQKLLSQYEVFVSQQIDRTRAIAAVLQHEAPGDAALTSVLQVLAAGVGNGVYQRSMEEGLLRLVEFRQQQAERSEADEEATSERQNRIMQQAIVPYAERLLLLHRTAAVLEDTAGAGGSPSSVGGSAADRDMSYLSPWQVTEAIVGMRDGVVAHHLRVGHDHVVVEVDEPFNKQVIYICCGAGRISADDDDGNMMDNSGEAAASAHAAASGHPVYLGDRGSWDWRQPLERAEIAEAEEVQQTVFHAETLLTATRLVDTLLLDTPLHPTRKTVVTGHGLGGAVAVAVGLQLLQRGFDMNNVITFGASKALQGTRERYLAALNPIRVVLEGDPLVDLPVTGAEGEPFVHIGEILLMSPAANTTETGADADSAAADGTEKKEEVPGSGEEPGDAPAHNSAADALSDMLGGLDDDQRADAEGEATSAHSEAAGGSGPDVNDDEDDEEVAEPLLDDETRRAVERRYRERYLLQHYVRHLTDASVPLTYAEGDEVWDEGDYRRRSAETEAHSDTRRDRDGPY